MSGTTFLATPSNVSIFYNGNTTITVSPSLGDVSRIPKGTTFTIPKTGFAYKFTGDGQDTPIASVWNHDDTDLVEISGGIQYAGTSPFEITVNLTS
ncbi:hypothetical protein B0H17DRAFT_1333755 [Mycena rosella]|uniref:Uncharacterized protein n=1 Tax=Mycena rosella TaxID=1033263 RepID=A0AAD7D6N3_MYCRO|nr:hypothetical protein B0H17DRAFT_1336150 [Mycena rosella]KAJ7681252.1 hypothetical protein B0H17DRAFT_1333755 [Mycena rosella]